VLVVSLWFIYAVLRVLRVSVVEVVS